MQRVANTISVMVLAASLIGCGGSSSDETPDAQSRIHRIDGGGDESRRIDVVFLHGVDGSYDTTWQPSNKPDQNWTKWLGEDNQNIAVWSINYPISTKAFTGETMGLLDRARNLLSLLSAKGFADRPERDLVFICHSFGGLVAKEMLRTGANSPDEDWQRIVARTRGVIFIATPNSGSDLANFVKYVAGRLTTRTVDDLKPDEDRLLELNRWYRSKVQDLQINTMIFCEKQKTGPFMVVPESSADLGVTGIEPIVLDKDHINIVKPSSRDDLLYRSIDRYLLKMLSDPPPAELPDPLSSGKKIPTQAETNEPPAFAPGEVVLHCQNLSNKKLDLVILDWSKYYANRKDKWRIVPLLDRGEASVVEGHFDEGCSGWFSIYVVGVDGQYSDCLGTHNLFFHRKPLIKILSSTHGISVDVSVAE